jgi:hypothetical protein
MPTLELLTQKEVTYRKDLKPIAIVKGDERNKDFNKFLCLNEKGNKGKTSFTLPDDLMYQVVPNTDPKKRDIFYTAGASGSGKSYQAKIICNNYHKLYPNRNVYLVSKLESDETLDDLKIIERIDYNDFLQEIPDVNDLEPAMYIFDDFDTLDKEPLIKTQAFINDLSIMGRHSICSVFVISHYLTNYKATRLILNEMNYCILFPQNTSYHQLRYLLQNYTGMDKTDVTKLKKLMSRWVCIHSNYPQFVISQNSAYLLHQD